MLEISTKQSNYYDKITPEEYYERAGKAALKIKSQVEAIRGGK